MVLLSLLVLSAVTLTLIVLLCACRAGHVEDVARGFVESPAAFSMSRSAPLPQRPARAQVDAW